MIDPDDDDNDVAKDAGTQTSLPLVDVISSILPGDTSAATTVAAIQPPSEHRPVPADLEAVAMHLRAYDPVERYPTAELAARDLVSCQDASRDGRGDLVRLLDERFPRARRLGAFPRPLDPGSPSTARRTVTGPWMPPGAPPPERQQDSQRLAGTSDSSHRRRRWCLGIGEPWNDPPGGERADHGRRRRLIPAHADVDIGRHAPHRSSCTSSRAMIDAADHHPGNAGGAKGARDRGER